MLYCLLYSACHCTSLLLPFSEYLLGFPKKCLLKWIPKADAYTLAPLNTGLLFAISDYYYCNPHIILHMYYAFVVYIKCFPLMQWAVGLKSHLPITVHRKFAPFLWWTAQCKNRPALNPNGPHHAFWTCRLELGGTLFLSSAFRGSICRMATNSQNGERELHLIVPTTVSGCAKCSW